MSIDKLARSKILKLPTINAPEASEEMIRLNANESPRSLWENNESLDLNRYPSVRPTKLFQHMAKFYNVDPDNVLAIRGSTEGIDIIIRTFCEPTKDNIISSSPTFDMYQFFSEIHSVDPIDVPLKYDDNFQLEIDEVFDAINDRTKVIFITTPNNPTATLVPYDNIMKLLENQKNKSIIVADEAYIEFSNSPSMINQINNFENLIIMRTLSKAFALAGARCGALIGSQRTIELLKKVVMPFTFSTVISQKIIQILSSNYREKIENHIQQIINERERVISTLNQLENVEKIWPSSANFFLVKFKDTTPVYNTFKKNHILVRAFQDEPELKNCARITIGTHDENNILLEAIKHSLRL